MSQPLLFLALRSRSPSFTPLPPKFYYLNFRSRLARHVTFSTRFVDKHFKLSTRRHNLCRVDLFAQETVSECTARRVIRCESLLLKFTLSIRERLRISVTLLLAALRELSVRAPESSRDHN